MSRKLEAVARIAIAVVIVGLVVYAVREHYLADQFYADKARILARTLTDPTPIITPTTAVLKDGDWQALYSSALYGLSYSRGEDALMFPLEHHTSNSHAATRIATILAVTLACWSYARARSEEDEKDSVAEAS